MISVRDHMVLALAASTFKYPAVRASRALDETGYTETRFWQRVTWLIDQPAVEAAYPAFVRRQRRLREARQAQRSARRAC